MAKQQSSKEAPSASATTLAPEKRSTPRHSVDTPAVVLNDATGLLGAVGEIKVCNVSLAGIGFYSDVELRIGSIHRIELNSGQLQVSGRVRITRCDRWQGRFEVGAQFIND